MVVIFEGIKKNTNTETDRESTDVVPFTTEEDSSDETNDNINENNNSNSDINCETAKKKLDELENQLLGEGEFKQSNDGTYPTKEKITKELEKIKGILAKCEKQESDSIQEESIVQQKSNDDDDDDFDMNMDQENAVDLEELTKKLDAVNLNKRKK